MAGLDVKLNGFAQLQARLESLATTEATKAGQSAIRSAGTLLKNTVKAYAPVSDVAEGKTHQRRRKDGSTVEEAHHKIVNNIIIKKLNTGNQHQVGVSVGTGQAYQSHMVEWGSIHNKPNPFMLRAVQSVEQELIDKIGEALQKQLIKRGA